MTTPLTEQEQSLLQQAIDELEIAIPENSPTIETDNITSRFSSAEWFENIQQKQLILAGLGGIGSYVGFLLSRVHVNNVLMYDDDKIESHNMSGQLYALSNIGQHKAYALYRYILDYSNVFYDYKLQKYTENSHTQDIMICGFDNMEARNIFFHNWLQHVNRSSNPAKCLFIDGRLAAEEFQIFCIKGDDRRNILRYQKEFLFTDNEADSTICSYKQTSFCANMIASYIVNLFVNFCANECYPLMERDLPFLTEYNGVTMYLKTTT